ncbi:hypothetical protein Tph_c17540 [Thermacetogenium phaeum DSM 12270]|uniref:Uncharacterized protein n=1 Tax=Thermacetogenium phaeum (strain ATCC BAA-254 / DSM 26808 / PB) TaxID=1089553 RepID=K4LIR5_THEPS|nr:hypothetical protein [Thermacetogenium phaeum]AFV11957.1 hypothetical protein Tph_c17540 [Thermacetogenium phaeum DSM 12270]
MNERWLLFLGVLALFLIAIVLAFRPIPQSDTSAAVEIPAPPVITPLGNDRFMVTVVDPSDSQGRYIVISLASGKPQVVAEGDWKPLLFAAPQEAKNKHIK